VRVQRAGTADDHAQVVFRQTPFPAQLRYFGGPDRNGGAESTVRAPITTASARARNSYNKARSRGLPNGTNLRLAGASLPSTVVATLMKTKGAFSKVPGVRRLAPDTLIAFRLFGEFLFLLVGGPLIDAEVARSVSFWSVSSSSSSVWPRSFRMSFAYDFGPLGGAAIAGDFVMFNLLRRRDDGGVFRVGRAFSLRISSASSSSPFMALQVLALAASPRISKICSSRFTCSSVWANALRPRFSIRVKKPF